MRRLLAVIAAGSATCDRSNACWELERLDRRFRDTASACDRRDRRAQARLSSYLAAFLLVVFRAFVRKQWAAYALLYTGFVLILMRVPGDVPIIRLAFALLVSAVVLAVLRIAGVLGITAFALAANVITVMPLTLDPGAFYAGRSLFALLVLIGLAAMAMVVSVGRKPVFGAA